MSFSCPQEWISFAHTLAQAARPCALQHFRSLSLDISVKDDRTPVTQADHMIETVWRGMITEHYPEHGMWGEEYARINRQSEWQWILDPIDGTKAFAAGRPTFGCLIGLHHAQHGFVLGVVDQPVTQWRWWAARGHGAFFNDDALPRTQDVDIHHARVALTGPQRFPKNLAQMYDTVKARAAMTLYGGDCLNYTGIADGSLHLTFDSIQNIYDIAATIPLIEETGGVITHLDGSPIGLQQEHDVLAASSPALHDAILKMYQDIKA